MRICDWIFRKRAAGQVPGKTGGAGSKFELFDFGASRFECSLSSLSHAGECEDLFLNRYPGEGLMSILGRTGLLDLCARKGYRSPLIVIGKDDNRIHRFRLYDGMEAPGRLLMEVRLSELVYTPDPGLTGGVIGPGRFNALAVEWLVLQSPRDRFTAERPRLPGQDHPGLGGVSLVAGLLETFAVDAAAAAVLDVPSHFHSAVMYSRRFRFADPAHEGMMRGVLRDLGGHSIADLSWAFVTGDITDAATGEPVPYRPSEQILALDRDLARFMASRKYRDAADLAMNARHYAIDVVSMVKKRKKYRK